MTQETATDSRETRSGYIALVGRPNAGKSTLLNALVGEKLSIVSPRAQTTWQRVTGIRTTDDTQMVFLDTPGLLEVKDLHQRAMLESAHEALRDAEIALLLLDPTRPLDEGRRAVVLEALEEASGHLVVVVNKVDAASPEAVEAAASWARGQFGKEPHLLSAREGRGVRELASALESLLPPGPFYYPADEIALQPVRFFVAEFVRETVFEQYDDEIPYAVAAQVEEFREGEDPVYIGVTLFVERKSQKGILIGKGGRAIRALGTSARARIETFLGRRVYLDLWVKPLSGWRRKRQALARLGYRLPEEDA
ncbi:GTPase Era [Gaopeijia maritima]|uniref:GTPase Era n=1 Tax=Gaopeijia maritima TaxID=3119007 RepID=A0ABU9E7M1_9BACT